jgi:hypothetical protein
MTEPAGSFMSTATSDAVLAWSVITGIGGLFGFASSIFLVYDRLVQYRPIASLGAVRGFGGTSMSQATPTLRIKNVAPFDILIGHFTVEPRYYSIAPTNDIRGMAKVLAWSDIPILLAPAEDRELAIVQRDQSGARRDKKVVITIHWRRGRARWLPRRPVSVPTSIADIEARQEAAMNT